MPEVVEAERRQLRVLQDAPPALGHVGEIEGRARLGREDPRGEVALPPLESLGAPLGAQALQANRESDAHVHDPGSARLRRDDVTARVESVLRKTTTPTFRRWGPPQPRPEAARESGEIAAFRL
jgi:hypothetical protein